MEAAPERDIWVEERRGRCVLFPRGLKNPEIIEHPGRPHRA